MLPATVWKPYEPRFVFPTFRNLRTLCSFSIPPDFVPLNPKRLHRLAAAAALEGRVAMASFVREYVGLVFAPRAARRLRFRVVVTNRHGEYLGRHDIPGSYPPGGSIDVDITQVISGLGLAPGDYLAILVMSRGRTDRWRSSPGSYSMTYIGQQTYSTYRTGGFTRSLNDPSRKKHVGFRGINPKVVVDDRVLSSVMLINHSSAPHYNATATPTSILLRPDGATCQAAFGSIPPFGAVERSMEDLFGEGVIEFLRPTGGRATLITTCQGVTLASLHLLRARNGSSMAIEHSRPSHTYLLNGVGN